MLHAGVYARYVQQQHQNQNHLNTAEYVRYIGTIYVLYETIKNNATAIYTQVRYNTITLGLQICFKIEKENIPGTKIKKKKEKYH